jgi:2-methylisocitrate lyase-like PEP mutase family enzyme
MNKEIQKRLADAFRQKHQAPPLLLLPNAWDALSARVFEAAGFEAIATTSGGVAWALGFPDGEKAPWDEVVAATNRIVRTVRVPVQRTSRAVMAKLPTTLLAVWQKSFAPA